MRHIMGYDIFPGAIHIDNVGTCNLPTGSQSRNHPPETLSPFQMPTVLGRPQGTLTSIQNGECVAFY